MTAIEHRTDTHGVSVVAAETVLMVHPGSELYGSDRMLLESVRGLREQGYRVVVALPTGGPLEGMLLGFGAEVERCTVPVLRKSAMRPGGMLRLLADSVRGLREGSRLISRVRPGRIYVSTITIPLWIHLARLRRVPVVCHVHEAESAASAPVRAALTAPLLRADRVIANSQYSIDVAAGSFRSLAHRATVVYNGVEGPRSLTPCRERLTAPLRIAYVGRLSPRKGVDVAVSAVSILARGGIHAELELIGEVFEGYEWYEEQLRFQVAEHRLEDVVHFRGFQSSVWDAVQRCDLVVVPSRGDEPFGNTAVEATLCGRPVIASATSGLLEATAGYRSARTVEPDDPYELADAIAAVGRDWAYMRMAAGRDILLAEERHSPKGYRSSIVSTIAGMPSRRWRGQLSSPLTTAEVAR